MWISDTSTTKSPAGQRAELVTSPSGRYHARLWRCCDITDRRVTSHGCDDLLVYTGNGSALIYNSAPTNLCRRIGDANLSIEILDMGAEYVVYATYPLGCYRLDLSQNDVIELSPDECSDG